MTRLTKALLAAGLFGLVFGLLVSTDVIDSKACLMLTVALPAGAICLGLFFISYIFENESARFDAEQQARLKSVKSAHRENVSPESGCYDRAEVARR